MDKSKSIVSHMLTIGLGSMINMLIGLLTTPVITRVVDPATYGRFSIFSMYANMLLMVCILGLDQGFIRFYYSKNDAKYQNKLLRFCCFAPILIIVVLGLVYLPFATITKNISINEITLLVYAVILIFNRFAFLQIRLDYKSNTFTILNILQKILYVVFVLSIIFVAKVHNYYYVLIFSLLFSTCIPTFIGMFMMKKKWYIKNNNAFIEKKSIIKYSLPFVISTGIITIFQATDKIALNYFCTYAEVGIYASTMTLVNIFAIVQTSFNTVWGPLSVEQYEKNPNNKKFFREANNYIIVLMFVLGLSIILCKDLFAYILGEKYREAAFVLPFLVFYPMMYTISETSSCGINFKKKSAMNIIVSLVSCVANIIGNAILVPLYGTQGAAISTGLSYIIFLLVRTYLSERYFHVGYNLKKFFVILFCLIIFSFYNIFNSFDYISLILYIVNILVLLVLYKNSVISGIKLLLEQFKLKFNR